jgi:Homeodomain-like domain
VFVTWPSATVERALRLKAQEIPDREIARELGVPIDTVRNWFRGRLSKRVVLRLSGQELCAGCETPVHDFAALSSSAYSHLLGLYLGDGCIARVAGRPQLRITMDIAYPRVIAEAAAVTRSVFPQRKVGVHPVKGERCVNVSSYHPAVVCHLPQHGPGKKHQRAIVLEGWQRAHVEDAPGAFLRGLIHSDGWRGDNRVNVKGRSYSYPRYQFSNRSDDIRGLFTWACDLLDIAWRPWGRWHISVARREAVVKLDEFVGLKT